MALGVAPTTPPPQDTSVGTIVAQHKTKQGACDVMTHNPYNAVVLLGHANGTVHMWTPNITSPVVKMLCHKVRLCMPPRCTQHGNSDVRCVRISHLAGACTAQIPPPHPKSRFSPRTRPNTFTPGPSACGGSRPQRPLHGLCRRRPSGQGLGRAHLQVAARLQRTRPRVVPLCEPARHAVAGLWPPRAGVERRPG